MTHSFPTRRSSYLRARGRQTAQWTGQPIPMLSYRHGFHAGYWADVHKHAALALLLAHLRRKASPFCVVDPFAGDGIYDLAAPEAQKTGALDRKSTRLNSSH